MDSPRKIQNCAMLDPLGSPLSFPLGVSIERSRTPSRRLVDILPGTPVDSAVQKVKYVRRNSAGVGEEQERSTTSIDAFSSKSPAHIVLKLRPSTCDSHGTSTRWEKHSMSSLASILTSPIKTRNDDFRLKSVSPRRRCVDDHDIVRRPKRFRDEGVRTVSSSKKLQQRQRWLIPAEHPCKTAWDILTIFISFANAYATHAAIRDRQFGNSWLRWFAELWFVLDILLNFFTEYRTEEGRVLQDCQSVWARYLTTWFVIDALSLIPAESLYIQPVIEQQNRRGFFKKTFFRSKAVVRVTRILRGRHLKLFGRVANQTKHAGVGAVRLLRLLIKYIPKYILFFRKMKGVVVLRVLRQVHFVRKLWRNTPPTGEKTVSQPFISWDDYEDDIPLY